MFETLFGSEMPLAARFFIAFLVVLALIGLTAWLVRRFGANRVGAGSRGRQPRLAVIDAATVDGRRRLVLIRRDNIEHLLMIGGPTDLVVEPNIVRAVGARDVAREPARITEPRVVAPSDNGWPLQTASEPPPAAPARSYRASATEEPWHPPEPGARARPAEPLAELTPRLPEPTPRGAPPVVPPAAIEPAAPPQTDHNLAEMAQQLEAALRRAPMPESRPPVTDPLAAAARPAPSKPRVETKFEPKLEPKFEPKPEPKFEPKIEASAESKIEPKLANPEAKPGPAKAPLDSLEEEMANLLGRPPGKS